MGLRGVCGLESLKSALSRGVILCQGIVRCLKLCKFGVLGTAVLRELFRPCGKVSSTSFRVGLRQVKLLRERFEFELREELVYTTLLWKIQ